MTQIITINHKIIQIILLYSIFVTLCQKVCQLKMWMIHEEFSSGHKLCRKKYLVRNFFQRVKVLVSEYRNRSIGTKLFPASKSTGTGVSVPVSGTGKIFFLVLASVPALFFGTGTSLMATLRVWGGEILNFNSQEAVKGQI